MKTKAKKGVSLVVLAITIVVIAILATLIPITVVNLIDNARMTAYIKDLEQIQDGVTSYIISNGSLEGIGTNQINQADLIALVSGETEKQDFESDLKENLDFNESDTNEFIAIDLSKIGVENTSTGLTKLGNSDVYYVSEYNQKVYYPYGRKIGNETYFALTSRLTGKTNLATSDETGNITIETDNTIITKLSTNTWSNSIDLYVNTTLAAGETLTYTIGNWTTSHSIESLPATINLSASTLSENEKIPWETINVENQIVTILRTNPSEDPKSKIVHVNNLDISAPIINDTVYSQMLSNTTRQGNYNIITIPKNLPILNFGNGGVANNLIEVRYDYVSKINEVGDIVPYYDSNPTIDQQYLLKFGKVSTNFVLKIPENVSRINLVIVDKAGNVSNDNNGTSMFAVKYYRRANINWTTEYAKYTQNYFGRKIAAEAEYNYTSPPIPVGFRPVNVTATAQNPTPNSWDNVLDVNTFNSDYDKGLVIEDMSGNQFVWVPVNNIDLYNKWWTIGSGPYQLTGRNTAKRSLI